MLDLAVLSKEGTMRKLFAILGLAGAMLVSASPVQGSTAPACSLVIPALQAQADGSGTVTGHVHGSCNFAWHSQNQIQFKDRWQILGVDNHAGGAAGQYVSQPVDRDEYHGDGYWREVVIVYNRSGTQVFRLVGPVSEFAS